MHAPAPPRPPTRASTRADAPADGLPGRSRAPWETSRWVAAIAVLAAATVLGLIESSQVQYDRAVQGAPITWGHALTHGLPRWYAWALLLPLIVRVADRVRDGGLGWPRILAIHAAAGILFTLVQVFFFSSVSTALHPNPDLVAHLRPAFLKYVGLTFLGGLVTYTVLVLGRNAWIVYREDRRREREAARLELRTAELKALLAEAQLGHLQNQLQPHFLFNTLHTLNGLIRSGQGEAAARMSRRMADFLRRSLELSDEAEIEVGSELGLLADYTEVQRARFGDRLRVSVSATDEVGHALVPTLLLQPIVENAVRHGIERKADAGAIEVRVEADGGDLRIRVRDDGPGPESRAEGEGSGIGLANTRSRIRELYGDAGSLELRRAPGGGTEVEIRLPLRTRAP